MKGVANCSFRTTPSKNEFGKVLLISFAIIWKNLLETCIFVEYLLMKSYLHGALKRKLLVAPFLEYFNIATLGKCL